MQAILDVLVPLQTKAHETATKIKKEIEYWERKCIAWHNSCAPTVTDEENDKTLPQNLRQIKIGTH